VYFAHGISVRTTTAVLGTFGGIAVTVLIALAAGRPTGMTGADGEAAQILYSTHPHLSLSTVFLAGVIISGLGALNDVTITQASSAWELRRSEEHTSELQSRENLVCRLLLEKKKRKQDLASNYNRQT